MLFIICYALSCLTEKFYNNKYLDSQVLNIFDFMPFLIFIVVTGFRYNVGQDYENYAQRFNLFFYDNLWGRIELSYELIVKLTYFLGFNQQFIFLIYALITYLFLYLAIKNYDTDYEFRHIIFLFIYIFILINSFNAIRQMAAASIFFFSFKYVTQRKILKYSFFILLAFMLHGSAILCLFFYFIPILNFYILLLLLFVSLFFLKYNIINSIIFYVIKLFSLNWYEVYLESYNTPVELSSGLNVFILFVVALYSVFNLNNINLSKHDRNIIKLFIVYVILLNMSLLSLIATRFLYYPMYSILFIFPVVIKFSKSDFEKYIYNNLVSLYGFIYIIKIFYGYRYYIYDGVLKYSFKIFT